MTRDNPFRKAPAAQAKPKLSDRAMACLDKPPSEWPASVVREIDARAAKTPATQGFVLAISKQASEVIGALRDRVTALEAKLADPDPALALERAATDFLEE